MKYWLYLILSIFLITVSACDPCKNNDDSDDVHCTAPNRPLTYFPVDSTGNNIFDLLEIENFRVTYFNKHNNQETFFQYVIAGKVYVGSVDLHDSIKIEYNDTLSTTFIFSNFKYGRTDAEECCPSICYLDSFITHVNDSAYINSPAEVIIDI